MFKPWPATLPTTFGPYRAVVLDVTDGDGYRLLLDLGFNVRAQVDVRLYGVNCPELNRGTPEQRAAGRAARDFARALLPAGSRVRVTTLVATSGEMTMTFARYVAAIELPAAVPTDLASVLVAANHAIWCDRDLNPLPGPPPSILRWSAP